MDYKELLKRGHDWRGNNFRQETNVPRNIIAEMSTAIDTLLMELEHLSQPLQTVTASAGAFAVIHTMVTKYRDGIDMGRWLRYEPWKTVLVWMIMISVIYMMISNSRQGRHQDQRDMTSRHRLDSSSNPAGP